jgi:hypothetical protein
MKSSLLATLLLGAVALASARLAVAEEAVFSCTKADGSVELSSEANGTNCEKLVSAPDAPAAPAAASLASAPNPAPTAAPPAAAKLAVARVAAAPAAVALSAKMPLQARLSHYRDAMLEQASNPDTQQTNATSAASRRYLMMDRTTYQKTYGVISQ